MKPTAWKIEQDTTPHPIRIQIRRLGAPEDAPILEITVPGEWSDVAQQISALPLLLAALIEAWQALGEAQQFILHGRDAATDGRQEVADARKTIAAAMRAAGMAI